jgi:hypothetical protein
MTVETSALPLTRIRMQRPKLPGDLIRGQRLLDRLHGGSGPNASDDADRR